jgi:hypothetical protein
MRVRELDQVADDLTGQVVVVDLLGCRGLGLQKCGCGLADVSLLRVCPRYAKQET